MSEGRKLYEMPIGVKSTMTDCLDFFTSAGAFRRADDGEILLRFDGAYIENPDIAVFVIRIFLTKLVVARQTFMPQLIEIKGATFADRLRYIASFN